MSELIERAFRALGSAPTWRELELVADTLRASGDEDAIAALTDPDLEALANLAAASGSSGVVALDLATEFGNPDAHAALRDSQRST